MPELKLQYVRGNFPKVKITSSEQAYKVLLPMFDADMIEYREEFVCLFTNKANNTIGYQRISTGGTYGTVVNEQMILTSALLCGAQAIIMAHNHPSGETKPSDQDKTVTKKIYEAARLLNITLLDHLIITPDKYLSFSDEGLM